MRVILAAGLLAGGATLMPAAAADLGGNCCADLEERVAELEATTARKGNRKVSLTISGQVSTALMFWDSGDRSDVYVVDVGDKSLTGSSFQLDGSARINPNLIAGFQIVVGIETGARSHQVSQNSDDGGSRADSTLALELANWYLDHKQLGRLTVGRINTATAGISAIDLGGAGVIANASVGFWNRSFILSLNGNQQASTWGDLLGGNSVNGASLSRANAISYTTPTFGGFSISAAWGENDVWDVALRYAGEFSGFRVAAGIGYIDNSNGLNEVTPDQLQGREPSQWKGSASIHHMASGLYLSGSYVEQDQDIAGVPNTVLWYLQGGIARNWTGLGNTVFYAEYARVEDGGLGLAQGAGLRLADGSEATVWGIGVVQHLDAAAMELYLAFRQYRGEADNAPGFGDVTVDDFNAVMGGARIRF